MLGLGSVVLSRRNTWEVGNAAAVPIVKNMPERMGTAFPLLTRKPCCRKETAQCCRWAGYIIFSHFQQWQLTLGIRLGLGLGSVIISRRNTWEVGNAAAVPIVKNMPERMGTAFPLLTRKPWCRKETAQYCSCSFRFKVRWQHTNLTVVKLRNPCFRAPNITVQNSISRNIAMLGHSRSRVLESVKRR